MPATIKPNSTALDFSRIMTMIATANIKTESPFSNLLSKRGKAVSRKADSTNSMAANRFLCPLMPLTR